MGLTQNLGLLSTAIKATSTLNVGIGTTSPNVSNQGANNTLMTIQGQSGSYGMLEIGATTNTAESLIGVLGFTSTNVTGGLLGFISMASEGTTGTNVGGRIQFSTKANGGGISERMRITSGGNVGIGTVGSSNARLTVAGVDASTSNYSIVVNNNTTSLFYVRNDGLTTMQTSFANAYRINDTGGGWVTWNMQNAERWSINYLGRFAGYGAGTLTTDGNGFITASSDRNLKDIIKPLENVLDKIINFEPVYFKWNDKTDLDKDNVYISTIAQSIQKDFPEAVGKMADGTLTVQDRAVMAILVKAIQELKAEIDQLKNK
jgi:hypothetical protein